MSISPPFCLGVRRIRVGSRKYVCGASLSLPWQNATATVSRDTTTSCTKHGHKEACLSAATLFAQELTFEAQPNAARRERRIGCSRPNTSSASPGPTPHSCPRLCSCALRWAVWWNARTEGDRCYPTHAYVSIVTAGREDGACVPSYVL